MPSSVLTKLRAATKLGVHHLGLLALLRRVRRRDCGLVLRYHAVAPDDRPGTYAGPDITIPRRLFAAQMRFLQRAYAPVPLAVMVDALAHGEAPAPGSIAVTLDDGYADNYTEVFPVVRELRIPATVYVVTECLDAGPVLWTSELRAAVMATRTERLRVEIGGGHEFQLASGAARQHAIKELTNMLVPVDATLRRRILATIRHEIGVNGAHALAGVMLTSAQIREMHAGGVTIGAHTRTHSNMTLLSADEARDEIAGSRARLEEILGAPVPDFAYPNTGGRYPHFNAAVAGIIRDLGFRSAVTSRPGVVAATSDRYQLSRIGVSPRLYDEAPLAVALERYRNFGEAYA
jgi:peptidoglycan/xylan/chitin deacetylase (PgdA/CDA1 family)